MKTYQLKSIGVTSIEDPKTGRFTLEFQPESVENHQVDVTLQDILRNRSWITGLFISLMVNIALFGLLYGGIVLGYKIDFASPAAATLRIGFTLAFFLFLIAIMILYSVPAAVKNIKQKTVQDERGEGRYKVIDEKKWPAFQRLLDLKK